MSQHTPTPKTWHHKFKVSLSCIVSPCLKNQNQTTLNFSIYLQVDCILFHKKQDMKETRHTISALVR